MTTTSAAPARPDLPLADSPTDPIFDPAARDRPSRVVPIDSPCGGCGYNLRSLPTDGTCPECGRAVAASLIVGHDRVLTSRVDRRWALLVLSGLVGLIVLCPGQIRVALTMRFGSMAFGSAPYLNVPAPKVWAVPLVQRSLGSRPETLGVDGTWLTLMGLAALFLVTTPHKDLPGEPRQLLRMTTRWLPPLLCGGFFGFLMNAEYTYYADAAVGKYAMFGIVGVELPATILLLAYIARLARDVGQIPLERQLRRACVATALLQFSGVVMLLVAKDLASDRKTFTVQLWSALYTAGCVLAALLILGALARLVIELAVIATPGWISRRLR